MEEKKTNIKRYLFRTTKDRKSDNKNAGITLIALVVTIIVLLILAGVAIATLTGDNRAINKN